MTPPLPPRPSLTQEKHRAKELLAAHKQGDASCCEMLRHHETFADKTEADILAAEVKLSQVQHALARSHGFKNWRELKTHIEQVTGPATPAREGHIPIPHYAGEPIDLEAHGIKYGFRHDPMDWVNDGTSPEAAAARAEIFGAPTQEDREVIEKRVAEILAMQNQDGSFPPDVPEGNVVDGTGNKLQRLLRLGLPKDSPEVSRAVDFLCRTDLERDGHLTGSLGLALTMGWQRDDELLASFRAEIEKQLNDVQRIPSGCPWTVPNISLLAAGKHLLEKEELDRTMNTLFGWVPGQLNAAGCFAHKDPWGILSMASEMDHPICRDVVIKQLPLILRAQHPDRNWGRMNLVVLKVLVTHGLLGPLRDLPPLPPDWRIVRSIPAPDDELNTMAWDGQKLWVYQPESHEAIALSPQDGQVIKRLKLPGEKTFGICRWDDALGIIQLLPDAPIIQEAGWAEGVPQSQLLKVDPDTGEVVETIKLEGNSDSPGGLTQVDGSIWFGDTWAWLVTIVDPSNPTQRQYGLLATAFEIGDITAAGDGVWHYDTHSTPLMVKSAKSLPPMKWDGEPSHGVGILDVHDRPPRGGYWPAKLLDFGDMPFPGVAGIAHDGKNLWVLDSNKKRICIIEKTESGKELTAALAAKE